MESAPLKIHALKLHSEPKDLIQDTVQSWNFLVVFSTPDFEQLAPGGCKNCRSTQASISCWGNNPWISFNKIVRHVIYTDKRPLSCPITSQYSLLH